MSEIISKPLDFSVKSKSHSQPIMRMLKPLGQDNVQLSNTSAYGPTEISINSSVYNLARSMLMFQLNVGAPASANYNHIVATPLAKINRITLSDQVSGALLADVSNVGQVASQMRAAFSFNDLQSRPTTSATSASATETLSQLYQFEGVEPNKKATGYDIGGDNIGAENPYTSPKYVVSGAQDSAVVLNYAVPLSDFKFTTLALDKMIFCPTNLTLAIYWEKVNAYASEGTASDDPSTGQIDVSGACTITNIGLNLYNEQNMSIQASLTEKVMSSGLSMPVPYLSTARATMPSSDRHNFQLNLTSAYGNKLLFIANSPFSTAAYHSTKSEKDNIQTYNTFIDHIPILYNKGLDARKGEHYTVANKHYLKDSAIQSPVQYDSDFHHYDVFAQGFEPLHKLDGSVIAGLDLNSKMSVYQWEASLSAAASYTYLTTVCGQKLLTINSSGMSIV